MTPTIDWVQHPGVLHAEPSSFVTAFWVLQLLAACGLLWVVWCSGHRRRGLGTLALVGALTAAFLLGPAPTSWPPAQLLTPLQNGNGRLLMEQLYAQGVHAAAGFDAFKHVANPTHDFRGVARMNLWLTMLGMIGLGSAAARIAGSLWAAPAAVVLRCMSVVVPSAAFSELPAPLLTVYLATGFWLVELGSATPRIATAALVLLSALAASVRPETLGIALPVVTATVLAWTGRGELIATGVRNATGRLLTARRAPMVLVAVAGTAFLVQLGRELPARPGWALAGVNPFNPSILTLPALATGTLSATVGILSVVGLWATLTSRRGEAIALGATFIVSYRMYYESAHGVAGFMFRHVTLLEPTLVLLTFVGWRWARRRLPGLRTALVIAAVLGTVAGPLPRLLSMPHYTGDRRLQPLLTTVDQVEFRFLASLTDAYPACTFVSPVPERGPLNSVRQYAVFGRDVPGIGIARAESADQLAAALDGCVLLYRGQECSVIDGIECDPVASPALDSLTIIAPEYTDPSEYGVHVMPLEVALFPLRGADR